MKKRLKYALLCWALLLLGGGVAGAQVLQRHCRDPHARLYRAVPLSLAFAGGAAPAFPYPQP